MDEQMSPDLLSDLPLGIIYIILSFVPVRDAIRTSLLSRQWRYIWTGLPNLLFDVECVYSLMEIEGRSGEWVIDFISQALLLHKGPIHKFELCLPLMGVRQCVDHLLLLLSRSDIKILELENPLFEDHHSDLYSCQSLTHLKLSVNTISPPPPSFNGFLFLMSLYIDVTEVNSSTIASILAHSPLLENLILYVPQDSEITICAPNLKYFHLKSRCAHLSVCTTLLEEFTVDFEDVKHFSFHESLVFHHLRIIKLPQVTIDVVRLITRSPNLQNLELDEFPSVSLLDSEFARDITYDSLKSIKMKKSGCGTNEMKFIKFLLARSPVLERLMYTARSSLSDEDLLNLKAELLSCHRACANAEIVIDKPDPCDLMRMFSCCIM